MPLDNTESLDSRVKHHKNQSTLQKRRPSKEEDEQFLAEVSTSLHAAKLRSQVPEDKLLTYHTPVEFSWKQFGATLVYENLPPVLLSPIAVLLIERSFSRAWHVMNHRSLLALSREHNSVGSIIGSWVVLYPIMWVIPAALLLKLFGPEHLVQNVDLFQIILAYLFLFVRNLIISVKYGYFRPEDYEQLSRPVPHWDEDRTNRRLVGVGWSNPGKFPGLIEDELTCAMDENDVALQGISFKMKGEVSERLRSHPTDELFTAETSHNAKDEVTTGFVLHQIVSKVYNLKQPTIYMIIILLATLAVMSSTFILRKVYGLSAFGETTWETLIFIGCFLGFLASLPNFGFGFICAFDFQRRTMTLKKLGELILHPGVRLSEFLYQKPLLEDENTPEQDDPKIKTNDSAQSGSDNPQDDAALIRRSFLPAHPSLHVYFPVLRDLLCSVAQHDRLDAVAASRFHALAADAHRGGDFLNLHLCHFQGEQAASAQFGPTRSGQEGTVFSGKGTCGHGSGPRECGTSGDPPRQGALDGGGRVHQLS